MNLLRLLTVAALAAPLVPGRAATIVSAGSGHWNTNASTIWVGGAGTTGPRVGNGAGATDSVEILAGHLITFTAGSPGTGGTGTNDFALGNGNVVTLNGGIFAHANNSGNWFRIGQLSAGTIDIKDGAVYLPVGNVQVGLGPAGNGIIRIGDGTGAAGSAILNLRDAYDGTSASNSLHVTELNLGSQLDNTLTGSAGFITIESDGVLEGAMHTTVRNAGNTAWVYNQSVTRIGRYGSEVESQLLVKAGGKYNARGSVEIGANRTAAGLSAKGLLHLDGAGAIMTHSFGELTLGYTGDGRMIVENGAEYIRLTNALDPVSGVIPGRNNHYIARNSSATGTLIIRTGGKFIRDTGGAVGDLFIGTYGRATVTVESGGEFINRSTNWDWIGVNVGSEGAVYVNDGGKYTTSASIVVGRDAGNGTLGAAQGILQVNGGDLTADNLHVGQNGSGVFRLIKGSATVDTMTLSRGVGNSTFDVQGGELLIRDNLFAGGDSDAAWVDNTGPAVATMTQSGGTIRATYAVSIGLSAGHTATFDMTGGEFRHASSDVTVGEGGTGRMYVGVDARFYDESTQASAYFFVGRKDGSDGRLIVDGYLEKTNAAAGIWVGHGTDLDGLENKTTGRGLIGGNGTIVVPGSILVGNYGTITAGTETTAGLLTVNGGLNLISSTGSLSQSTLFVNFDSASALGADRIVINGEFNIDGGVIDGVWDENGATGVGSRYWIVVNEDDGQISSNLFANASTFSTHFLYSDYFNMGADAFVTIDGMDFAMFHAADFTTGELWGGNDLVFSAMGAVPEPSLGLLLCAGLGALVMRRRRRRRGVQDGAGAEGA